MKIKKLLYALPFVLPSLASAQDFFSGSRGPAKTQLDLRASYSGEKLSGMVIPKFFGKHFLLAAPFSVGKKVENKGLNLGLILEDQKTNAIAAVGLFKDEKGKYTAVNPQFYLTRMEGPFSFDLEGSLKGPFSATIGRSLGDRLRIGGSIILDGKKPRGQGNIRFELKKDHQYWMQVYFNGKRVDLRVAANYF